MCVCVCFFGDFAFLPDTREADGRVHLLPLTLQGSEKVTEYSQDLGEEPDWQCMQGCTPGVGVSVSVHVHARENWGL